WCWYSMTSQRPPSISTLVPLRRSVTLIILVPSSDWLSAAPPGRVDPGGRLEPAARAGQQGLETGQCITAGSPRRDGTLAAAHARGPAAPGRRRPPRAAAGRSGARARTRPPQASELEHGRAEAR